ncbi:LysR family transcriptional regulator [Aureimonas ureilytica]|uniref:LysR family transcriptional regulator n=1 Tax=Aureimonas ureilytica TaxID=401562 RepID=A0A175RVZ4_9HYPH|nr:LysR family transcriptional regulator [Aureimonas ureilytica]KTQ94162.1 LysR family transcriptional regulator [Aureimonas ureilytica]KTR07039.1 LysR family transcriptional regulator [Aureimonas ureilytica]
MKRSFTPTLSELQAFGACADSGSVTEAARRLGLTQSAVSRSLASLEARLGVELFHRVRKRLVISDAGRAMLRDTERILADLNTAALTVMAFGDKARVLRLAVLPTFGTSWLIPRLADFHRRSPGLSIDLAARLGPVDFEREPFDAAIQRTELAAPGTDVVPFREETLVAVAAPSLLPPGGGPTLSDAAIAGLPLLQQSTRPELWLEWFRDAGLDPVAILRGARFEHFGMVLAAARCGLGVALVPKVLALDDLAEGRLCRVSDRELPGPSHYALIYPARSRANPALAVFREWIESTGSVANSD